MANALPDFEGQAVSKSSVRITNAGDGLSEALDLEPKALHNGEEVCFVLRGKVSQVNHKETAKGLARIHTVTAEDVVEVDDETAAQIIRTEKDRISKLKDEASGQTRIEDQEPQRPTVVGAGVGEPAGVSQ